MWIEQYDRSRGERGQLGNPVDEPIICPSLKWIVFAGVLTGLATAASMFIMHFKVREARAKEQRESR